MHFPYGNQGALRATKALLKFTRDHGHAPFWVTQLEEALTAVEAEDAGTLKINYELFSRAGMGSYLDWYPTPIEPYENDEYAETIWWALFANWKETLKWLKKC